MTEGQWQFYFDAPKGTRILSSRFIGITQFSMDLWWSYEHEKWLPMAERGVKGACTTVPCRSFKAFKSHLRRHPELIYAGEVILVSKFIGYNVTARHVDALNTSAERVKKTGES